MTRPASENSEVVETMIGHYSKRMLTQAIYASSPLLSRRCVLVRDEVLRKVISEPNALKLSVVMFA